MTEFLLEWRGRGIEAIGTMPRASFPGDGATFEKQARKAALPHENAQNGDDDPDDLDSVREDADRELDQQRKDRHEVEEDRRLARTTHSDTDVPEKIGKDRPCRS